MTETLDDRVAIVTGAGRVSACQSLELCLKRA